MDLRLKGKKVVIGGATRGISRAIVEFFANEGAELGIFSRNVEALENLTSGYRLTIESDWGFPVDCGRASQRVCAVV